MAIWYENQDRCWVRERCSVIREQMMSTVGLILKKCYASEVMLDNISGLSHFEPCVLGIFMLIVRSWLSVSILCSDVWYFTLQWLCNVKPNCIWIREECSWTTRLTKLNFLSLRFQTHLILHHKICDVWRFLMVTLTIFIIE